MREFATDETGLKMPIESTDQEILDAVNVFAAQRLHNYIRNWKQQKVRAEREAETIDPLEVTP